MTKSETIEKICNLLKLPKGGYTTLHVGGIIPVQDRTNKRFTHMIGNYLSAIDEDGKTKLVLLPRENSICYWKFPNLKKETYEDILAAIEESLKPKAYVIMSDIAYDYEQNSNVVLVTTDRKKALEQFNMHKKAVRKYAKENEYEFDEGDTTAEAYEDGYAAQNHYYVRLYEKNIV
jgi:hypothetical protein